MERIAPDTWYAYATYELHLWLKPPKTVGLFIWMSSELYPIADITSEPYPHAVWLIPIAGVGLNRTFSGFNPIQIDIAMLL